MSTVLQSCSLCTLRTISGAQQTQRSWMQHIILVTQNTNALFIYRYVVYIREGWRERQIKLFTLSRRRTSFLVLSKPSPSACEKTGNKVVTGRGRHAQSWQILGYPSFLCAMDKCIMGRLNCTVFTHQGSSQQAPLFSLKKLFLFRLVYTRVLCIYCIAFN